MCSMSAEVEEQIGHLRGQLLRSEQEMELMRIKLEEEKKERQKAQDQVSGERRFCENKVMRFMQKINTSPTNLCIGGGGTAHDV